jgi:hypothetical protein
MKIDKFEPKELKKVLLELKERNYNLSKKLTNFQKIKNLLKKIFKS